MQLPRVNQKLELQVLRGPYAAAYSTYVENVDDEAIYVVHPLVAGRPVPLAIQETVRLEYAVENTARLAFPTRVLALEVSVLPIIVAAHPREDEVERIQQRDHVRLDAVLDVTCAVRFIPGQTAPPAGAFVTRTRDISGNGAQILCSPVLPSGTQLDMELTVGGHPIRLVGEVIRQVEQPGSREIRTGVHFVSIAERDRDEIIRYIFAEHRERRRRGLL